MYMFGGTLHGYGGDGFKDIDGREGEQFWHCWGCKGIKKREVSQKSIGCREKISMSGGGQTKERGVEDRVRGGKGDRRDRRDGQVEGTCHRE